MKIGIFGGSFNPPHKGHIHAASTFLREAGLDRIFVIPAGIPPHKKLAAGADDIDRLNMALLAFSPLGDKVTVSDCELCRAEPSYSIDTISSFREAFPDDELFLFVGEDMFLSFDKWQSYRDIFSFAKLFVMKRCENTEGLETKKVIFEREGAEIILSDTSPIEVSSTEIREKLMRGESCELLADAVTEYIRLNGLYSGAD